MLDTGFRNFQLRSKKFLDCLSDTSKQWDADALAEIIGVTPSYIKILANKINVEKRRVGKKFVFCLSDDVADSGARNTTPAPYALGYFWDLPQSLYYNGMGFSIKALITSSKGTASSGASRPPRSRRDRLKILRGV